MIYMAATADLALLKELYDFFPPKDKSIGCQLQNSRSSIQSKHGWCSLSDSYT